MNRYPPHPSPSLSLSSCPSSTSSSSSTSILSTSRSHTLSLYLSFCLLFCSCFCVLCPARVVTLKPSTARVAFLELWSCLTILHSPLPFSSHLLCISLLSSFHILPSNKTCRMSILADVLHSHHRSVTALLIRGRYVPVTACTDFS